MPKSRLELATNALQANALPIKLLRLFIISYCRICRHVAKGDQYIFIKSKQNRTTIKCVEDTCFTFKLYSLNISHVGIEPTSWMCKIHDTTINLMTYSI